MRRISTRPFFPVGQDLEPIDCGSTAPGIGLELGPLGNSCLAEKFGPEIEPIG